MGEGGAVIGGRTLLCEQCMLAAAPPHLVDAGAEGAKAGDVNLGAALLPGE